MWAQRTPNWRGDWRRTGPGGERGLERVWDVGRGGAGGGFGFLWMKQTDKPAWVARIKKIQSGVEPPHSKIQEEEVCAFQTSSCSASAASLPSSRWACS